MVKIVAIVVILCAVVSISKKIKQTNKVKQNQKPRHIDDTETYIPESVMHAVLKCPKCGATVPLSSDKKHVTMFCSFCGNPLNDANKLMEQAHQNKQEERSYEIRIKELEDKEREHAREMQRLKNEKAETSNDRMALIATVLFLALIIFACMMATGVFR